MIDFLTAIGVFTLCALCGGIVWGIAWVYETLQDIRNEIDLVHSRGKFNSEKIQSLLMDTKLNAEKIHILQMDTKTEIA